MRQAYRKNRSGQAVLMLVVGMSVFLMAALGLAIDASHLYVHRQLAQAAADAAAQAGMLSIFTGSYSSSGTHPFSVPGNTPVTCASNDAKTPCYYAQTLNGFNTSTDTVTYTANPSGVTVPSPATGTYAATVLQVTVTRNVPATLTGLLGWNTTPGSSACSTCLRISATGTAAITSVDTPVPILVTHPTLSGAFSMGGSSSIKICGGPALSIQVNSSSSSAMSAGGSVDLSQAGPADDGSCTTGTGASFGLTGGPISAKSAVSLGSTGYFFDPTPAVADPLSGVSPPADPTTTIPAGPLNPARGTITGHGCPSGTCDLIFPGKYTSNLIVKGTTAVFAPGIYYLYGADLSAQANGDIYWATGLLDSNATTTPSVANCCGTGTGWGAAGNVPANSGALFYFTGPGNPAATGTYSGKANSSTRLIGAPNSSSYKGILFFADRNAASNTYTLDGGGGLILTGTIYLNSSRNNTVYQTLHFQGNPGSNTTLSGEIITSVLEMQGNPSIVMNLNSTVSYRLDKIALVQ